MTVCKRCGDMILDYQQFCYNCGNIISNLRSNKTPDYQKLMDDKKFVMVKTYDRYHDWKGAIESVDWNSLPKVNDRFGKIVFFEEIHTPIIQPEYKFPTDKEKELKELKIKVEIAKKLTKKAIKDEKEARHKLAEYTAKIYLGEVDKEEDSNLGEYL